MEQNRTEQNGMNKKKKICFICSSGGHFSEMTRLKNVASKFDNFLVTEKTENFNSDFSNKFYFVREINRREKFFILHIFGLFIKEFFIFIREKPDVIISTGALCSVPMIKIGKIFKRKIIYIESYARVNDLSLTGKQVYKNADLFLVQWPELVYKYPKAIYLGSLFF